jgi:hypothetical protein
MPTTSATPRTILGSLGPSTNDWMNGGMAIA